MRLQLRAIRPVFALALACSLAFCLLFYDKSGANAVNLLHDPAKAVADNALDQQLRSIMAQNDIPGMSVLVLKNGKVAKMQSYGFANTVTSTAFTNDTILMLASVSKVFTGIALMQLHEDGEFQLDDDVNGSLPFSVRVPGYPAAPITFRMLLTHTSSIDDSDVMDEFYNFSGDPTISLAACLRGYLTTSGQYYDSFNYLNSRPGTRYNYSNMGTALEGYLVEVMAARPFNEYCNEHLFDALGMNQTRWFLREYDASAPLANPHVNMRPLDNYGFADYPDGMLHSSISDLARFMRMIFQNGAYAGRQILSAATLQQMFSPQIPELEPSQGLQFYKETFSTNAGKVQLWGHSGGELGIATEMYFDFENNIGIAVLANAENGTDEVAEALYNYALTVEPRAACMPYLLLLQ